MALAELECSVIHLGDEDVKRYPELADALSAAADFYEVNMIAGFDMDFLLHSTISLYQLNVMLFVD